MEKHLISNVTVICCNALIYGCTVNSHSFSPPSGIDMIFPELICFSDLVCAPMDTAAVEEEWGNGKHDSLSELGGTVYTHTHTHRYTVCVCVRGMTMTHCNLMQKVRLCSTLENTVSHSDQWGGVLLAFSSM